MTGPNSATLSAESANGDDGDNLSVFDLLLPLAEHVRLLIVAPLVIGLVALGVAYLLPPTYTARATFLTPQPQNSAASALASLGPLAGIAGNAVGVRTAADQYVSLMQSANIGDRIIDRFKLMTVYDVPLRTDARRRLTQSARIALGKKDGLVMVEIDDADPQRAADMANAHIEELRRLTASLAVTEAQQRRIFFEAQLKQTRDNLAQAQESLQSSGFTQGALRAEPRAAAESYARLRAEATATEVRLQALRGALSDSTPEVKAELATLGALRAQLARAEQGNDAASGPGYVGKYREFKYQETLFELFARQYELARVDESRDGTLIQVVDAATPPERKTGPKRGIIAIVATVAAFFAVLLFVVVRDLWRNHLVRELAAARLRRLKAAAPAL